MLQRFRRGIVLVGEIRKAFRCPKIGKRLHEDLGGRDEKRGRKRCPEEGLA